MTTSKPRKIATGTIAALRERVTAEGVETAYQALLSVCKSDTAPAQAKATAATTLFRAAGMLEGFDDDTEKDPSDMTAAELARFIRKAEARFEAENAGLSGTDGQEAGTPSPESSGSIFV